MAMAKKSSKGGKGAFITDHQLAALMGRVHVNPTNDFGTSCKIRPPDFKAKAPGECTEQYCLWMITKGKRWCLYITCKHREQEFTLRSPQQLANWIQHLDEKIAREVATLRTSQHQFQLAIEERDRAQAGGTTEEDMQ